MRIKLTRQVQYFEVDTAFQIKLGSLFRLMQEAAIIHSEKAGYGPQVLFDDGRVWVASKFGLEIIRYPKYGETLVVSTWCQWFKSFKTVRNFHVQDSNGAKIAASSGTWLYFDLEREKLITIPQEIGERFTTEGDNPLSFDIDRWKPASSLDVTEKVSLTTRYADFDPVGHVNNAVYFSYLETLLNRWRPPHAPVEKLRVQFQKEIDRSVFNLEAGLQPADQGSLFRIHSDDLTFATGEVSLAS